jgi:hypothetical protein
MVQQRFRGSQRCLIHDDTDQALAMIGSEGKGDVAFMVGNAGRELVADLALAEVLLLLDLCATTVVSIQG